MSENPVLGIVVALLIGLVVRTVGALFPQRWQLLPYTAVLFVLGVAVGELTQHTPDLAYVSDSLRSLESISPTVLFTVFLPALILPSGFQLQWHVVKRVADKALLLAVPGTLFNAALTAIVARYVLPYGWPWSGCWLFGGTLAATDPVAVIAIMDSVGASLKLSTVIEGEALLNDGVAFVLFEIFSEWAAGEDLTAGGVVAFAFKASLGSLGLGLVWAALLTLWLAVCFNDAIVEISLALVAGYSLWIVCDEMLGVSGVLALVFFAGAMGAAGRAWVSRPAQVPFGFFFSWVDWTANTLIFILSGLIIALELADFDTITGIDWAWAAAVWAFLFIIRVAMTVLLYPLLSRGQYGLDWRDAVVLAWSGLRGAVGLTLALIVYGSEDILDQAYRERFLFFIAFAAAATLLVQGSTTGPLLKRLGYLDLGPARQAAMLRAADAVERLGAARVAAARREPSLLGEADWERVEAMTRLDLTQGVLKRRVGRRKDRLRRLKRSNARSRAADRSADEAALADLRERLLAGVQALFRDAFDAEFVSPDEQLTLLESTEAALDRAHSGLYHWVALEADLAPLEVLRGEISGWRGMWRRLKAPWRSKTAQAQRDAALTATFAAAHAGARRELCRFAEAEFGVTLPPETEAEAEGGGDGAAALEKEALWDSGRVSAVEFVREALDRQGSVAGAVLRRMSSLDKMEAEGVGRHVAEVAAESRREQAAAEARLAALRELFPEAVAGVRTSHLALDVLKREGEYLERLRDAGLLEEREAAPVLARVQRRLQMLHLADFQLYKKGK